MTKDEIQWLLLVASNAPIQNTKEARYKASALNRLADEFDSVELSQSPDPEGLPE